MFAHRLGLAITALAFGTSWIAGAVPATANPAAPASVTVAASAHTLGRNDRLPPPIGLCLGYDANDTAWVETSTNPVQWSLEEYGEFCPPKILWTCTGSLTICEFDWEIYHEIHVINISWITQAAHFTLVPSGQGGVNVLTNAKTGYVLQGTLDVAAAYPGAGAIGVGFSAKSNTVYVSVSNPSGSATAGVLAYTSASSPSAFLSDTQAGPTSGGVVVDKSGDVFWAFDDENGVGHVDEFPGGKAQAERLKIQLNGAAGDLAMDKKGNLVVSSPGDQTITIYSPKGGIVNSFQVTGAASSISLDAKSENLYVADITNNQIDQYAYPSGKLVASSQPPSIDGTIPTLAAASAYKPQEL
jgi:hypothetical protein